MSNELVEAAFASDMDTDNSPKTIKNIAFKLGKYVMIFLISNLMCSLNSLIYVNFLHRGCLSVLDIRPLKCYKVKCSRILSIFRITPTYKSEKSNKTVLLVSWVMNFCTTIC